MAESKEVNNGGGRRRGGRVRGISVGIQTRASRKDGGTGGDEKSGWEGLLRGLEKSKDVRPGSAEPKEEAAAWRDAEGHRRSHSHPRRRRQREMSRTAWLGETVEGTETVILPFSIKKQNMQ